MFEYIKQNREISFKHWRYRLLHWTFGIQPKTPEDSSLPGYMYSHYCPLFHLTNIIAIALPIVILAKIIFIFVQGIQALAGFLLDLNNRYILYKYNKREERMKSSSEDKDSIDHNRKVFLSFMKRYLNKHSCEIDNDNDKLFDDMFFTFKQSDYQFKLKGILKQDLAKCIFDRTINRIKKKIKEEKEREEARKKRIMFWIGFARPFIKGFLGLLLVAAVILVGAAIFYVAPPVINGIIFVVSCIISGIVWLVSNTSMSSIIDLLLKAILVFAMAVSIWFLGCFLYKKTKFFSIFKPLLSIVYGILKALAEVTASCVESTFEFISVFYEDNCPKIKIVSEEDEIIGE